MSVGRIAPIIITSCILGPKISDYVNTLYAIENDKKKSLESTDVTVKNRIV